MELARFYGIQRHVEASYFLLFFFFEGIDRTTMSQRERESQDNAEEDQSKRENECEHDANETKPENRISRCHQDYGHR